MPKENKKHISVIKKKYFYKNSDINTEQIKNLMKITKDYVSSINLNYDFKLKHRILQSTLSLIVYYHNLNLQETLDKD